MPNSEKVCLIVDDCEVQRSKMRRVMRTFCPQVPMIIARSVQEAWTRLRDREVAIVFMENALPDGNGTEMALEMQSDRKAAPVPVIMFSDNPTPFMFAKAQAAPNVREIWRKRDFNGPFVQRALAQHAALA